MTYEEALAYTTGLLKFGVRLGLERLRALLQRVGDPHTAFQAVHVAGTNGKGSTTAFIATALREAGYRTGSYFSPHLFDYRERIQINGVPISPEAFARQIERLRPVAEALAQDGRYGPTTEFELVTAAAFCHFAEEKVEVAVLEVGLGGRLDATNVIPPPLVAVITSIGLDHQEVLGPTLGQIAREKAGILKPGVPLVTGVDQAEALEAIQAVAHQQGCPVYRVAPAGEGAYAGYGLDGEGLWLRLPGLELRGLRPGLRGRFQQANAAVAATALHLLASRGLEVPEAALRRGLEKTWLPGRFQVLRLQHPPRILVLDVAHNQDGARALAEALEQAFPAQKKLFVVGMKANHDPAHFLPPLKDQVERIWIAPPRTSPRPPDELVRVARALGLRVEAAPSVPQALQQALGQADPHQPVVLTGSFLTVGELPEPYRRLALKP
ncbi:bifunctional folylpolyglutamate synthase/dihydrofolate synthase [Meiothermus sp. QL-1]|uniref:bifunctional folylpolyglutamate synthase/dihydrofolate synthase n=1 Tax=Meiothermus sp. QL-1 TaxID=2058095 RepID=UPI000E0ADEA3|nr:folylpolyglutamate synthase/dihydrofolate synthase family protein [Meiothermus sp. QL-1]RDI96331.1 bifunctional folylpolyglutamate synthase/dihydrofolate synthase [Meiothermus sp. QL-1]